MVKVSRAWDDSRMITLLLLPLLGLLSRAFAHGTADEVADKWASRISASQNEMKAGVARVTTAPGQAAANKKQKWVAALMDTNTQDKWERNVRAVSLQSWQDSMNNLGISRAAAGAAAKKQKFVSVMNQLLPFIDNVRATVRQMPDLTYEDREQRMVAMARGMRNFRKSGTGA